MLVRSNLVQHSRTKHIEIDIHFVREKVSLGHIRVLHDSFSLSRQFADIMTKGLPSQDTVYALVHPMHKLRGDVIVHVLYVLCID
jgi:hypothetical protein